eukprot:6199848-Pleurochrysis_carterae.AAC.1
MTSAAKHLVWRRWKLLWGSGEAGADSKASARAHGTRRRRLLRPPPSHSRHLALLASSIKARALAPIDLPPCQNVRLCVSARRPRAREHDPAEPRGEEGHAAAHRDHRQVDGGARAGEEL